MLMLIAVRRFASYNASFRFARLEGFREFMTTLEFQTLGELFVRSVDRYQKEAAFLVKRQGSYLGVSSRQALRLAAGLAMKLAGMGLGPGDRLGLLAENRAEWALTDYAALALGVAIVPIYPTLLEGEIEYILRDSGCKGIVVSTEDQLRKIANIGPRLPDLGFTVIMDQPAAPGGALSWHILAQEGASDAEAAERQFRERALAVTPGQVATIPYTSGTTGKPKGVVLTHSNIVSNILASRGIQDFTERDVGISFLPLSHIYERMIDYFCFSQGVTIAYAESLEALPQNLLEVRPTVLIVVPRVLERVYEKGRETARQKGKLAEKIFHWSVRVGRERVRRELAGRPAPLGLRLRHAVADRLVFSQVRARLGGRLRFMNSGSAPLGVDVAEFFFAAGIPIYEGYGLTETSPVIAVNRPGALRLGTVGQVIPGVEIRMGEEYVDEEGGKGREILVRGPNVASGYYRLEADTREAFVDGWFNTGDLGELDADGFLKITGRKKHLFKTSGGKYVAPEKLENLLQGHPEIAQVMTIGNARKFVSALIVPNYGRLENEARKRGIAFSSREELATHPALREWMQQRVDEALKDVAPYERIRQISLLPYEFSVDLGELSPTQKIRRHVVEERYKDLIDEMYRRQPPQPVPRKPR